MATGKWIPELTARTPLADAALRVLGVRLEVVRDYLGLALRQPEKDAEYVHQLRVGTRRAGAALDIFADCLPVKIYKKSRKRLKKLRRAAGSARDWDVFLAEITSAEKGRQTRQRAGLDFLIGYAMGQRAAAQDGLEAVNPDNPFAFERLIAGVLHEIRKPKNGADSLLELARPVLGALLRTLEEAASQDLTDYNNLHQVRIAGKRLRYAMEVFADCFAPEFRDVHYAAVEEMQEILGRANDSHVASKRLEDLSAVLAETLAAEWKRYKPSLERLRRQHAQRLPEERRHFEQWWQRWQQSGGEAALMTLLKMPAAETSA